MFAILRVLGMFLALSLSQQYQCFSFFCSPEWGVLAKKCAPWNVGRKKVTAPSAAQEASTGAGTIDCNNKAADPNDHECSTRPMENEFGGAASTGEPRGCEQQNGNADCSDPNCSFRGISPQSLTRKGIHCFKPLRDGVRAIECWRS